MPVAFEIKGLTETLATFNKLPTEVQQEVDDELTATAFNIAEQAMLLAPVDVGNLKNRINVSRNEPLLKQVSAEADYSAFVEFGTGTSINIPQLPEGLQPYAIQFRGRGLQGKHPVNIKGKWAMVPYQLNLHAQPFFFPAVNAGTLELAKRLKVIVENTASK